jgi:CheY-like chemotaxis protein
MSEEGPILIVDDNPEEHRLLKVVMEHLGVKNQLISFENGEQALHYLMNVEEAPFIILCDMDMPVMNGLELCQRIFENQFLRKKSIPFIFRTGSANVPAIARAYEMTVQGVFQKPHDYHTLEEQISTILQYWRSCIPSPI